MSNRTEGVARKGWEILGSAIASQGYREFFYIMGGPTVDVARSAMECGVRGVDVRHESAAAMMAHSAARRRRAPALCMAASGPATANLAPGLANALVDGAPVVALGGASPLAESELGAFQEFDQLGLMGSVTKHAERIYDPRRIPERLEAAAKIAMAGRPGPVYLELPGDVLYRAVEEPPDPGSPQRIWPRMGGAREEDLNAAIALLEGAQSPLLVVGSGILWSDASGALRRFAEATGVPVYATPQARGAIPDDHDLSFPGARSLAFREADLLVIVGTRMNFIWGHFRPRRFPKVEHIVQIDADPTAIASARQVDVGIVADAAETLEGLLTAASQREWTGKFQAWVTKLREKDEQRRSQPLHPPSKDGAVHPLTLCNMVRDAMDRDDVLVVDGQDILTYARQNIPSFDVGNRLNSGTFGTMGVGVPYGIGAKVADPDARVIVLSGDGALGFSFMELDTAVRHGIPVTVIVSLNGGHTSDPEGKKPGRDLGYTKYHDMAAALGCHTEYVDTESSLGAALKRALASGRPALVNVVTERVSADRTSFTSYET